MANNSIPVFWYMLFDQGAVVLAEEPDEDGPGFSTYHALTKPTPEAVALARSRWPRVRDVLGAGADDLFNTWAGYVESKAGPHIHCETFEWSWLFKTPRLFEIHLNHCIAAFDHVPGRRKGRPALNKWWRELLGQCGALDGDENVVPLGEFTYCGWGLGQDVPWSEEATPS